MWDILSRRLSNALSAAVLLLLGVYGLLVGAADVLAWTLTLVGGLLLVYNLNAILLRFQLWADRKLQSGREQWQTAKGKLPTLGKKQPPA